MRRWALVIVAVLLLAPFLVSQPAFAQVPEADGTFEITETRAFRNVLETNDQLYLVTSKIENSVAPSLPVDETYLLRLIDVDGSTELASTTFYPYQNNGYDIGLASVYFSVADLTALGFNANETYNAVTAPNGAWERTLTFRLQGNPTLHWFDTTAVTAMGGAVADDGGVRTTQTTQANNATANDMTLLPAVPAVNDAYYFGSSRMFDLLTVNIGTAGNWTGAVTWEVWNGSAWVTPTNLSDSTVGFTAGTGYWDVSFDAPSDWQTTVVNGLDLYWLRIRVTSYSAIVTQPLGTQSWTNSLSVPPSTESGVFAQWYDDGTISGTSTALTVRMRSVAGTIEQDWGGTTDLISLVGGVLKLTDAGEEYFSEAVNNLRTICPDLFADLITTPTFEDSPLVEEFNMGGETQDYDVFGVNWYAQTFTPSQSYNISAVELLLYRVGSPGNMTVSVRATVAGLPTNADLLGVNGAAIAGTISANGFSTDTDGRWYEVSFADWTELTAGTVYAFVVRAPTGNAANYVAWLANGANPYAGGQSAGSGDSGVTWGPTAGVDFSFAAKALGAYSMSYRNQLATLLVGTPLDMTSLGAHFGLSRMWMSTLVWLLFGCMLPAFFFARGVDSFRPVTFVFALMLPIGALIGFIYLEIAVLGAFLSGVGAVYVYFYRGAA